MAEQKLRKYELIYLVQPEATEEERAKVAARVQAVLDEGGAYVLQNEEWGKRKLAYEIRKQNKAYYFYLVFITKPGLTAEIERILRMLDACLRFQTIKLEEGLAHDTITTLKAEAAPEAAPEAPAAEEASADA